ncbi:unnamed protein product [Closterium sp. NIES-65]|nr:unnamed protein product [Closterium sp. NIES-65]
MLVEVVRTRGSGCEIDTSGDIGVLTERLLAAEKSIVAVGASRGDPRAPVFEGCSPSPLLPSDASAAAADLVVLSRSVRRLPLARDAALARARGAGALEELAGAVEAAVEAAEGVGVAVGVVAGVGASVAVVEAEAAAVVAVGAEVAEVAPVEVAAVEEAAAEEVELVGVALRRGSAPVVVSASSSSSSTSSNVLVSRATARVSRAGVRTPPSAALAA